MVSSRTSMTSLRLDRYLASVSDYSRSDAKKLIKSGAVTVNGAVATDAGADIAATDIVAVEGQPLRAPGHRYFMLNKPEGYVSATRDRLHPTVLELLQEDNLERLHIAGRLDIDTTGLVLITDDGQWAHAVMSPNRQCWKTYRVETAEPIPEKTVEQFAKGVFLQEASHKGGGERTLPVQLDILSGHEARLRIREGRYHQVKRMFAAVGNAVTALHREAIGDIVLDPVLKAGEYRALSEAEVASVRL